MAQFVVVPPLTKVGGAFFVVTGKVMTVEAGWSKWNDVSACMFDVFRPYIRPSHQKILNETIAGVQRNPCALFRQLLRPHGLRIEATSHGWILKEANAGKGVAKKDGTTVVWA